MFSDFFSKNCGVYEIILKNVVEAERHMHCMLDKQGYMKPRMHTHTHTQIYVLGIVLPRKQWCANIPQCYVIRIVPVLFHTFKVFI